MSHSSVQRVQTLPRTAPRPLAPARHLRSLKQAGPQVQTWHVLAVTLVVALAAVALAIALRPAQTVATPVTWVALPDLTAETGTEHINTDATPAKSAQARPHETGTEHIINARPGPAPRKAGTSMFDDPDAVEDLTVGRALAPDAKPADRVSRAEFQAALAAQSGSRP